MKKFILFIICIFASSDFFADEPKKEEKVEVKNPLALPAIITEDLVLKPRNEPYTTNGFQIPRGVTLTIEPGVKINQVGPKSESVPMLVEGTLIVGKKGGALVSFEIPTTVTFSGANIEMNRVVISSATIILSGGTEGEFNNCIFEHILTKKTNAPFEMNIPKRGVLTFTYCNFINHHIDLPDNIQDAKDKIKFEFCAFTPRWDPKIKRYTSANIDSNIFLVGSKCDLHSYIKWEKMSYDFDPPVKTEWFIEDKSMKKSLTSMLVATKGFKVNFGPPYTTFKPEAPPPKEKK